MASRPNAHSRWTSAEVLGLLLLSAASLAFEINLTRLFSVAQFYHFAFMIVSIALLGFGASGTFLAIFPFAGLNNPRRSMGWLSLATSVSILGAYFLINNLPFDSFQIAWDRKQVAILAIHYVALALPFFFSGMATGMLLSAYPQAVGSTYAINLIGSALGCGLALPCPIFFGGEGTVLLSSALAAASAIVCMTDKGIFSGGHRLTKTLSSILILFALLNLIQRSVTGEYFSWLELHLSPYKNLSYVLKIPGTQIVSSRWNSFSRVDRVRSSSIRSLPGLSYRYLGTLPQEDGLLVDGDDLSPVILTGKDLGFTAYLPSAIAFQIHPHAQALILEPRGGVDIVTALALGAETINAVESNALIVQAAGNIYQDPRVQLAIDTDRSYTRHSSQQFDVVILSLSSSYHPVRSGAYSLAEDYRYTTEAFQDILARLKPDGLFVVTRWLQTPPSECLRAFGTAIVALEKSHLDPATRIVAFRGYNTATILVSKSAYKPEQLDVIRQFTSTRAFDLIYAPGIQPAETNQYNVLPQSVYYQAFLALLAAPSRENYYREYPLEVSPPTDDRPFFGHFFKWSQASQVFSELGKTWQPFGGAGYFVILALLALAALSAVILILLPVIITRHYREPDRLSRSSNLEIPYLLYYGLIGFGFMLVEIPLIQRFILFTGQPAYSLAAVLFCLLLFSGVGSQLSPKLSLMKTLGALAVLLIIIPMLLPDIFELALGLGFPARLLITILLLLPIGLLMGIPFSGGILWMQKISANTAVIPWIWAVNGAASVIASVLAALLAISLGFLLVFQLGALCYAGACLIVIAKERAHPGRLPRP
jgi:hypothetical protein